MNCSSKGDWFIPQRPPRGESPLSWVAWGLQDDSHAADACNDHNIELARLAARSPDPKVVRDAGYRMVAIANDCVVHIKMPRVDRIAWPKRVARPWRTAGYNERLLGKHSLRPLAQELGLHRKPQWWDRAARETWSRLPAEAAQILATELATDVELRRVLTYLLLFGAYEDPSHKAAAIAPMADDPVIGQTVRVTLAELAQGAAARALYRAELSRTTSRELIAYLHLRIAWSHRDEGDLAAGIPELEASLAAMETDTARLAVDWFVAPMKVAAKNKGRADHRGTPPPWRWPAWLGANDNHWSERCNQHNLRTARTTANTPTAARPAAGPRRSGPERASDTVKSRSRRDAGFHMLAIVQHCAQGRSGPRPWPAGWPERIARPWRELRVAEPRHDEISYDEVISYDDISKALEEVKRLLATEISADIELRRVMTWLELSALRGNRPQIEALLTPMRDDPMIGQIVRITLADLASGDEARPHYETELPNAPPELAAYLWLRIAWCHWDQGRVEHAITAVQTSLAAQETEAGEESLDIFSTPWPMP